MQKRRGVKAISNWLEGSAKRFYKEVLGGQQFDHEVYLKRGPFAKMVKEFNSRAQTIYVKQLMPNCTILC